MNAVIILMVFVASIFMGKGVHHMGDTDEEQIRSDKGILKWYLLSILTGVLAIPIMVMRETWKWNREKLSRFEWCSRVVRRGFLIVAGSCLHLCLLLLTSCSSVQPVTTERTVYKTDTLYKTNVRADTFRVLDSVYVNQYMKGDTVYKEKTAYKWRDKVSVKVDTIYKTTLRTDSIRMPIPVERKLSAWEETSMRVGKFAIGVIVMTAIILLLWLIHRRK